MDRELWVETDGFGRCRLAGNAHTFPGRISAWSETLGTWVTMSRSDVRQALPEAWLWIDGYLAGNEPAFHAFLGVEPYEAMELELEGEEWQRYQAVLETFRLSGSLPFRLNPMPRWPPPPGLSSEPWVLVGGQVLRWNGSTWTPQHPQPAIGFSLLMGTICDDRGHCMLEEGDDHFAACRDCGSLIELAPGR